MKSAKKRLTARELTVMNAIWDIGEGAGTSQIVKKLYEWYGEKLTPQAIGVYIDKLQRKEFITVTKPGNYYKLYEPRITKEQYMHEYEYRPLRNHGAQWFREDYQRRSRRAEETVG